LFDRGLDGVAKALRWAYGGNRIYLVRDEIGADADDDREIIPYCKAATIDLQVARVKAAGVSVWWIREEERKQMARPAVLFALARDIDRVAFAAETTTDRPIHVVSSVGRHARPIEVPFAKRRNAARRLPERPRPRIARPIQFGQKLFPE
jgi:hypothetical protein